MGSRIGVLKIAAKRIGISYEEYISNIASGLKWCTLGKHWQPVANFYRNAAKSDGLATSCRRCVSTLDKDQPTRFERKEKLATGLKWCSRCKKWLPALEVPRCYCRPCINQYERERYARDKRYRQERRQHARARKRNVEPISPETQEAAMASTNGLCKYCGAPATTFDHVIPVSKNGSSDPDNIVPACAHCNSSKGNRNLEDWLASRQNSS